MDLNGLNQDWHFACTHAMQGFAELTKRVQELEKLVHYPYMSGKEQVDRITALEQHIEMKGKAAKVEATKDLYAPLRSNVDPLIRLSNFARRLLDPHDLGHAVSFEVRELAREALGKEKQG